MNAGLTTPAVLFDSAGNVGIGTTTPFGKVSIEQGTETSSFWVGNTGSTTPSLAVAGVNGNGNVGIGAAVNATYKLNVGGSINVSNGTVSNIISPDIAGITYIGNTSNHPVGIIANNVEHLRVNAAGGGYWNNGNVGISTSSPFGLLSVEQGTETASLWIGNTGSTTPSLVVRGVNGNGNVGIGTVTPGSKLDVRASGSNANVTQVFASDGGALSSIFADGSDNAWLRLFDTSANEDIRLNTEGASYFNGGSLGIGTTTPWRKLSVTDTSAQFVVAYDGARYTQFTTNSTGDLTIDAQGGYISAVDETLFVCSGGACPSGAPSATGSIVAENFLGVGSSTPWAGISVVSGKAIVVGENTLATSTSMTVDWRNGNQQLVRLGTAATTISFTGFIEGQKLALTVCNPGTTGGAVTWGTQVLWAGGTAPTQTTTANKCDVWSFLATVATSSLKIFGAQSANF